MHTNTHEHGSTYFLPKIATKVQAIRLIFLTLALFALQACTVKGGVEKGGSAAIPAPDVILPSTAPKNAINDSNKNNYLITGTCLNNGAKISLTGQLNAETTCNQGAWSVAVDASSVADGNLSFQVAEVTPTKTSAVTTMTVTKDTSAPTLNLTSTQGINLLNSTSYTLTGTCTESGRPVAVSLGIIQTTAMCTGFSFSKSIDASSLPDGAISISLGQVDEFDNSNTQTFATLKDVVPPSSVNISGQPVGSSSTTSLNIDVAGAEVAYYKYKIGAAGSIDCTLATGYSATEINAAVNITENISGLPDGAVKLCAWARDSAGNYTALADTVSASWTKDTTGSSLVISSYTPSGSPSNDPSSRTVVMSGASLQSYKAIVIRTGACAGQDFSAATETAIATTFSFPITTDGTYTVCGIGKTPAGAWQGAASASSGTTLTIDRVKPSMTLASTASDPTNSNIPVSITFSESVTGFTSGDVTVANGSISGFSGSGASYALTITPTAPGLVSVSIAANVATDQALNQNNASSAPLTRTFDNISPTVTLSSLAADPINGVFSVTATFSEAVTGFSLSGLGLVNATASALAGTGTTYTFNLTPTVSGPVSVAVNSAAATDSATNTSNSSAALTRTADLNGANITNVLASANGTYGVGSTVDIDVTFDKIVSVTGTPVLQLETSPTVDSQASYLSGTGTAVLRFRYTVVSGDNSADLNYQGTSSLSLAGGTIKDGATNNAVLTLPAPASAGSLGWNNNVIIDTTAPVAPSGLTLVSPAASPSNVPSPQFNVTGVSSGDTVKLYSSNTCNAMAERGSATAAGNNVNVSVTPAFSSAATYVLYTTTADAAGNISPCSSANFSYQYDNNVPVITNISSTTANGAYKTGVVIPVQMSFSKNVTVAGGVPTLRLAAGASVFASYASGSGTSTLTFNYTIGAGDTAADLDAFSTSALALNGATILDISANNADLTLPAPGGLGSLGANKNLVIDTTAPATPSSLALINPASSPGNVATPTIRVNGLGATDSASVYSDSSCTGVNLLGTAASSGTSADVVLSTLPAPASYTFYSTSTDTAGNQSSCSSANVAYVFDSGTPVVTNVTSTKANGAYKVGDQVAIQVVFNKNVTVTGTPQLTVAVGSNIPVNYTSGSGTSTLVFNYTIASGHSSSDLTYSSTSALALNGGTIQDSAFNNADLTLVAPAAAGSLGANKNLVVDTTAPTAPSLLAMQNPLASSLGSIASPTVRVSGVVNGDSVALFSDASCTSQIVSSSATGTTIDLIPSSPLTAGTYTFSSRATDPAGNVSTCSTNNVTYQYDNVAPVVTSISATEANGAYKAGQAINVLVTFSKLVTVAGGTPQVQLETGATDRNADYTSGSGTATLSFLYTVQSGDTSSDLDYQGSTSLVLAGATVKDAAGNDANLTLPASAAANSLGANKNIVIDTTAPTAPSGLVLFSPASSPGNSALPSLTVNGVISGDAVSIFADSSSCVGGSLKGTATAAGTSVNVSSSTLAVGTYVFYAQSTDPAGNVSACSTANVSYQYSNTQATVINVTSTKANGAYKVGENILVQVQFSQTVNVTGTPQLTLETGTVDRVLNYTTQPAVDTLQFSYTVSASDTSLDLDYGSTTALALNGGTIKNTALNDAVLTLPTPGTAGSLAANKALVIDTTAPAAPSGLALQNPSSSPGIVTTPTITVSGVTSGDLIEMFSDSGCTTLRGSTTSAAATANVVVSSAMSAGSYSFYARATDPAGNASACSVATVAYVLDLTAPTVNSLTSSLANGTYGVGQVVPVQVAFSENVVVTGNPRLLLETGTTDQYALYTSGSGTSTLTFNYTVASGDVSADLDQQSTSALGLNSGTIKDTAGNAATLTVPAPAAANSLGISKAIVIDTNAPAAPSGITLVTPASSPSNNQTPTVQVAGVISGDTVRIYSDASCSTQLGSAVAAGITVNITSSSLVAGSYTIYANSRDVANNISSCSSSSLNYAVDLTAPVVSSVTAITSNGFYKLAQVIQLRITFDSPVTVTGTPQMLLETGATDRQSNYASGTGTTQLTFSYTVQAGDTSADLDFQSTAALTLNGGTIKDAAGNNATLTLATPGAANSLGANAALVIDTTAPAAPSGVTLQSPASSPSTVTTPVMTVSGVSNNDTVEIFTDSACSIPALRGSTTSAGSSVNVSTTTALSVSNTYSFYAKTTDQAGNASACSTANQSYTLDLSSPTVTGLQTASNGQFKAGQVVTVNVTFSENVPVTGTPTLTLETGAIDQTATYSSGTGTSVLAFTYTVVAGDTSSDLDYTSTTALALAGGTIKDGVGNNATLTLPAPGAAGSIAANSAVVIDTTAPLTPGPLTLNTPASSPASNTTPIIQVAGVVSGDTVKLYSNSGCTTQLASGTAAATTILLTSSALGGSATYTMYANSTDAAGNVSACSSPALNYTLDVTAPTVTNVSSSLANGAYKAAQVVPVQVTFDEAVTVTGTPTLQLETGTTDRLATYSSGTGTSTLTFDYTVQAGDTTADLNYLATSSLALAGGTIRDAYSNNATLTLPGLASAGALATNKNLVIDTTSPSAPSGLALQTPASSPGNVASPVFTVSGVVNGDSVMIYTSATCLAGQIRGTASATGTTVNVTSSALTAASYTYYAQSTDPAGNVSACSSANVVYQYDNTSATITNVTSTTADGYYKAGQVVAVRVDFSKTVNVSGGTPTLTMETGTVDQAAVYASGSGSAQLVFNYTIQAGDTSSDLDYAGINSLSLAGATIKDTALNDATLTLPAVGGVGSLSNNKALVIDTTVPTTPSGLSLQTPSSSPGNVSTPILTISGVSINDTVRVYSDAGCSTQVGSATSAGSAQNVTLSALTAGSYTFKATTTDQAGNISACSSATVAYTYDNTVPTVTGVSASTANGSYGTSGTISIQVTFSQAVTVTGTPLLNLETGTVDRDASYASGSGSTILVFTYTPTAGDTAADLDYKATTSLSLNSGTIKNAATTNATLTLAAPGAAGSLGANKNIVIDTTAPSAPSGLALQTPSSSPGNNTTPIIQVSGVVSGDTVKLFTNSGCTTQVGSGVAGGTTINLTSSTLSAATYGFYANSTDPAGNISGCSSATVAYVLDLTAPTVTNVTSSLANATYGVGQVLTVQVTFSESVNVALVPKIVLALGSNRDATYTSGTGSSTLTFSYTVVSGDNSTDLNYVATTSLQQVTSSTIKDAAGNDATLTLPGLAAAGSLATNKAIVIDTTAPSVPNALSLVTSSPNSLTTPTIQVGGLTSGDSVSIFTSASCAGGQLRATGTAGGTTLNLAVTTALSGSATYTFYAIATDPAGNASACSTANVAYVLDVTAPTVSLVTASTANGTYGVGTNIDVLVRFTEAVTISSSVKINLETGTTDRDATYLSGSGSTDIILRYTVQSGDTSADLDYTSTSALTIVSGTVQDAVGNNATLTLPTVASANSLGGQKAISIDSTPPSVPSGLSLITPATSPGTSTTPTVRVSGVVSGDTVRIFTDSSCSTQVATGTASGTTIDLTVASAMSAGAYTFYAKAIDPASNASSCSTANVAYTLDTTAPTVTSVTSTTADGTYGAGGSINVKVTFSEAVVVTGSPRVQLETGTTDQYATWASTSSTVVNFTYIVQSGDSSADLEYLSTTALGLNSGTIKDAAGNNATLTLPTLATANSLGGSKAIAVNGSLVDTDAYLANLVYWLKLDGTHGSTTITDSSTTTPNTSSVFSGLTISTADSKNGGASFYSNCGSAYCNAISSANTADYQFGTGDFSIEMWIKPVQLRSPSYFISNAGGAAHDAPSADRQWWFYTNTDGKLVFKTYDSTASPVNQILCTATAAAPVVTTGVWQHVAVSRASTSPNSTVYLFLNGFQVGNCQYTAIANLGSPGTSLVVGATYYASYIDELKIYKGVNIYKAPWNVRDFDPITITSATYGSGCGGVSADNRLTQVSALCSGKDRCSFNMNMWSDPNPSCNKPVSVTYSCPPMVASATKTITAGLNSGNETIDLNCQYSTVSQPALNKPTIVSVGSSTANATLAATNTASIQVTFSRNVSVTGSPILMMGSGLTSRAATYTSGSTTNILTFTYTVVASDFSPDLEVAGPDALKLNGGTITSIAGIDASLILPPPANEGSLSKAKALIISTTPRTDAYGTSTNLVLWLQGEEGDGTTLFHDASGRHPALKSTPPDGAYFFNDAMGSKTRSNVGSGSLTFNRSKIDIPTNTADFSFGTAAFTAEAWVMRESAAAPVDVQSVIVSAGDTATGWRLGADYYWKPIFSGGPVAGQTVCAGISELQVGKWTHIAATRTGNFVRVFVNGVQEAVCPFTENLTLSSPTAAIGTTGEVCPTYNCSAWLGALDEVKVYKGIDLYRQSFNPNAASILSLASATANGAKTPGSTVVITATYSQIVTVDTTGGTPRLWLDTGLVPTAAPYTSGTGTNVLTFTYTVVDGDKSGDLEVLSSQSAIDFNGGQITGANGIASNTSVPNPAATSISISNTKAITLSTTKLYDTYQTSLQMWLKGEGSENGTDFYDSAVARTFTTVNYDATIQGVVTKTSDFKNGTGAMYFKAAGHLQVPYTATLSFGTNDFTVEAWLKPVSNFSSYLGAGSITTILGGGDTATSGYNFGLLGGLPYLLKGNGNAETCTSNRSLNLGMWNHVAWVRSGSYVQIYVDGLRASKDPCYVGTEVINIAGASNLTIGGDTLNQATAFRGAIDDLRVYNGIALYKSNKFTPDTPVITNLAVSSPANGTYGIAQAISIQATFNRLMTVTGVPTLSLDLGYYARSASYTSGTTTNVLTFGYTTQNIDATADLEVPSEEPFTLSSATIASAQGGNASLGVPTPPYKGALSFNSNIVVSTAGGDDSNLNSLVLWLRGDNALASTPIASFTMPTITLNGTNYLLVASQAAYQPLANDFSIDFDYYATNSAAAQKTIFGKRPNDNDYGPFLLTQSGASMTLYMSSACSTGWDVAGGTVAMATNGWRHITLKRVASMITLSIDGVTLYSTSHTGTLCSNDEPFHLGSRPTEPALLGATGTIQNFVYSVGTSTYTTARDSTNRHTIKFVDGGVFYAADTATKKVGAGSIGFRESSYLTTEDTLDLNLGTADFTLETWYTRQQNLGLAESLLASNDTLGNIIMDWRPNSFNFYGMSAACTGTGAGYAGTIGTWYHFAVSRSGNVLRTFINGTLNAECDVGATSFVSPSISMNVGGAFQNFGAQMRGNIDELKVYKGVSLYKQNFTPDRPVVQSVSASNANSTQASPTTSGTLTVQATFSKPVVVTGTPTIALNMGTTNRNASYSSGSGTNVLNFTYTIQSGDYNLDLEYTTAQTIVLNGGTIKSLNGALDSNITLPPVYTPGSLGSNKNIVVNAAPTGDGLVASVMFILSGDADSTTNNIDAITDSTGRQNVKIIGTPVIKNSVAADYKYGASATSRGSVYFDGSSALYFTPSGSDFDFGTGDFTTELYFKSGAVGNDQNLMGFDDNGPTYPWRMSLEAGPVVFRDGSQGNFACYSTNTSFDDNVWHHFAASRSNGKLYLFVDGVLENTCTYPTSSSPGGKTFRVGASSNRVYYGYIDEVRITKGYARYLPGMPSTSLSPAASLPAANPTITYVNSTYTDTTAVTTASVGIPFSIYFSEPVTGTGTITVSMDTGFTDRNATCTNPTNAIKMDCTLTTAAGDYTPDLDFASTSALSVTGTLVSTKSGANVLTTLPTPTYRRSLSIYKRIGIQVAPAAATTATDQFWSNTTFLLRADGLAPLNSFVNSVFADSTGNFGNATLTGRPVIDTTNKKIGTGSVFFPTGGDGLDFGYSATATNFGSGEFTIEAWIRNLNGSSQFQIFNRLNTTVVGSTQYYFYAFDSLALTTGPYPGGTSPICAGSTNVQDGLWHHVALVQDAEYLRIFVDGAVDATCAKMTWEVPAPGTELSIAKWFNGNANIDDFRITKGVARYHSSFRIPAAPAALRYPDSKVIQAKGTTTGTTRRIIGDVLNFQVDMTEPLNTVTGASLQLETGTTDNSATCSAVAGNSYLTCSYTVASGDYFDDLDFKATSSLTGTINSALGNAATVTLPSPGATGSLAQNSGYWTSDLTTGTDSLASLLSLFLQLDNNLTDSSPLAQTVTMGNGSAAYSTANTPRGTHWFDFASVLTRGIKVATATGLNFGTGDYTLEANIRPIFTGGGGAQWDIMYISNGASVFHDFYILEGDSSLHYYTSVSGDCPMGTVTTATNVHIAASYSAGKVKLFKDGVLVNVCTVGTMAGLNKIEIGQINNTTLSYKGMIDHVKITKGAARYK